jgi:hypothetical protein
MNTVISSGVQAEEQAYRNRLRRAQAGTRRYASRGPGRGAGGGDPAAGGVGDSRHIREAADGLRSMGYELRLAQTAIPGKQPENYLRIMDPAYTAHGIGYLTPTMFSFSRALDRQRLASLPGAALTGSSVNFSHVQSAQPGLAAARLLKDGLPDRHGVPTASSRTPSAAAASTGPPQRVWDVGSFLDAALACRPEQKVALMLELLLR